MVKDRRFALKVKVKSLAAEARIIRFEERRQCGWVRDELAAHRRGIVRYEARHTLLAYGFLKGRSYEQLEAKCEVPPNWDRVWKMVEKYGVRYFYDKTVSWQEASEQHKQHKKDQKERFHAWSKQA